MLAPLHAPDRYTLWNQKHGAPSGRSPRWMRAKRWLLTERKIRQLRGPFAIQTNNTTRRFEYPWAFEAGRLEPGMRVLEVGGGLSGFQFVLDNFGCTTVNVDPGTAAEGVGWQCDQASLQELNHLFGARVELRNTTIENAGLAADSFDRAFSISVVEHLPDDNAQNVMKDVHRVLKPGGLFILTVDLFLNLAPFTSRKSNEYGRNQNIRWLMELQRWEMLAGLPAQLFGFDEFDTDSILCNLEQYLIGSYPALVQCLILRKPSD